MVIQSPSLANINLLDFGAQMKELEEAGITMVHIDIMDGHYVPNLCLPLNVVKHIRRDYKAMKLDVHLMVDSPEDYIATLAEDGADYISFHGDSTSFVRKLVSSIQKYHVKAGVVINPSQPVEVISPYAEYLDYVTLMAVEPGTAGQTCLRGTPERLRQLAAFRKQNGLDFKIFIDGGMTFEMIEECIKNGADVIVTGVYAIFQQEDGIKGAAGRFERAVESLRCEV